MLTAWVLLAEAMIAIPWGRNWQLSWWEWHILMAIAFALVATVVRVEQQRRRPGGPFASLYLDQTIARSNATYADALRQVVEQRARAEDVAMGTVIAGTPVRPDA